MIQFSISLSMNQIALLRSIKKREDGETEWTFEGISHWLVGVKHLEREKLAWLEKREKKGRDGRMYSDNQWHLTEKGRLVLQMVDIEIADAAKELAGAAPKPLRRSRVKALPEATS